MSYNGNASHYELSNKELKIKSFPKDTTLTTVNNCTLMKLNADKL